jgi:hypothetical protein
LELVVGVPVAEIKTELTEVAEVVAAVLGDSREAEQLVVPLVVAAS